MTPTPSPSELPELPPIDPKDSIPYSAIRYVNGYTEAFVKSYAHNYGRECARLAVPGWISVDERLPETDAEVLVCNARGVALDRWRMQSEAPLSFSSATIEIGMYWDEHEFEEVTHWMALPPAPIPSTTADTAKTGDKL